MNFYYFLNLILNTNQLRKKFCNSLAQSLQSPVLDFGCGNGDCAAFMPDGTDYIGIDNNWSRIQFASKKCPNNKFIFGSFDALQNKSLKGVNSVIFYGVLHHLSDSEIKNLFGNPFFTGKQIFSLDPCASADLPTLNKILNYFDRGKYIRPKNAVVDLLKSCRFSVEEIPLGTYNSSYVIIRSKRSS